MALCQRTSQAADSQPASLPASQPARRVEVSGYTRRRQTSCFFPLPAIMALRDPRIQCGDLNHNPWRATYTGGVYLPQGESLCARPHPWPSSLLPSLQLVVGLAEEIQRESLSCKTRLELPKGKHIMLYPDAHFPRLLLSRNCWPWPPEGRCLSVKTVKEADSSRLGHGYRSMTHKTQQTCCRADPYHNWQIRWRGQMHVGILHVRRESQSHEGDHLPLPGWVKEWACWAFP